MAVNDVIDNPLLEAALQWTRSGFSVLPVGRDKRPRVAWRGLQTTPWTEDQVTAWWTANPHDNVGVIPASGDMAVIDADIYKDGGEGLADLFMQHGLDNTDMVIARTGSGGRHYWFHAPGGLPSRPLSETVDIKSIGGYVLVPPSVNESGEYEWEQVDHVDDWVAVHEYGMSYVPTMPDSLIKVARGENTGSFQDRTPPKNTGSFQEGGGELVSLARAMDGREPLMRKAIWFAGHEMLSNGLDLSDHQKWLEIAWRRFEGVAKGRNGRSLEDDHPPSEMLRRIRNTNLDRLHASYTIGLAEKGRQAPYNGGSGDADEGEGGSPVEGVKRRKRYVIEPWDSDDFPGDSSCLVRNLLSKASLSVLYGPSNSGKTFQAMALAFAVGTGGEFYGLEAAKGRVVYLAAEGAANIRKRRAAIKKAFAEQIAELDERPAIDLIGDSFDFCSPDSADVEMLAEDIGKADLIIVDTLAAVAVGGDENTAPTMLAIINAANRLIKATGAHVMLIHHMGKSEEKGARGHSSLRAALDTEIECIKTPGTDGGRLKVTKQRDMEIGQPMGFKLVPVVIREGAGIDDDDLTSCVVEPTSYRATTTKKAGLARDLERIIHNKFAAAERPLRRPQRIEVNGSMVSVLDAIDSAVIRDSFRSLPENDGVEPGTLRQRYRRALREVCQEGAIVYGSEKIGLLRETS